MPIDTKKDIDEEEEKEDEELRKTLKRVGYVEPGFFGKSKRWRVLTWYEWTYFILAIASLSLSIAYSIERAFTLDPVTADFTYAILVLFTSTLSIIHVYEGIKKERAFDLGVFTIAIIIVYIYIINNYIGSRKPAKLIRLVLATVTVPILSALGIALIYQYLPYSKVVHRICEKALDKDLFACTLYLFVECCLKFSFQMGCSVLILYFDKGFSDLDLIEITVLLIGIIAEIVWIIFGVFALRKDSLTFVYLFMVVSFIEPTLIAYNIYRYATNEYSTLRISVYASSAAAILVRIVTVVAMWKVKSYFDIGINKMIYTSKKLKDIEAVNELKIKDEKENSLSLTPN